MKVKKLYAGTALVLIGLLILQSFKFNSASTCYQVWTGLTAECFDVGGSYGLVNDKTSFATAFNNLKSASDAKFDGSKITDGKGNVYVKYSPSSTETFQGKGYNIVGGLSISSGPNSVKKIRFTKN